MPTSGDTAKDGDGVDPFHSSLFHKGMKGIFRQVTGSLLLLSLGGRRKDKGKKKKGLLITGQRREKRPHGPIRIRDSAFHGKEGESQKKLTFQSS